MAYGKTSHTEAIQITYDPKKISYSELLEVFWKNVDPFDDKGQFCDRGKQYRPEIFYHDESQKKNAEKSKTALKLDQEIKVAITKAGKFHPAEDYHQDYYKKNPIRYKIYRYNCGRDKRLEELWGKN